MGTEKTEQQVEVTPMSSDEIASDLQRRLNIIKRASEIQPKLDEALKKRNEAKLALDAADDEISELSRN